MSENRFSVTRSLTAFCHRRDRTSCTPPPCPSAAATRPDGYEGPPQIARDFFGAHTEWTLSDLPKTEWRRHAHAHCMNVFFKCCCIYGWSTSNLRCGRRRRRRHVTEKMIPCPQFGNDVACFVGGGLGCGMGSGGRGSCRGVCQ